MKSKRRGNVMYKTNVEKKRGISEKKNDIKPVDKIQ